MAIDVVDNAAMRLPRIDIRAGLNPLREETRAPIIANAPRAQTSLKNKYGGYWQEIVASDEYNPMSLRAMEDYDRDRVARGQAPLNEADTRRALAAASMDKAQTEEPDKSLWNIPGNILGNAGDILQSLPSLPLAMVEEVKDLGTIGEHLASDEGNALSRLASAPGVRMLPGAYTVENLSQLNPGELLKNPLFTAMDLMPFGSQLAKGTRVAKVAKEAADGIMRGEKVVGSVKEVAEGTADFSHLDAKRLKQISKRPLAGSINNMVDDAGNVIRTPMGEFIDASTKNRYVKPLAQWFSQGERDVIYEVNTAGQRVHNIVRGIQGDFTGKTGDATMDQLSREAFQLRDKMEALDPDLIADPARIPAITDALDGRTNIADLSPTDATAAEMYRDLMGRVTQWQVEQNYQSLFNGEIYEFSEGTKLRTQEAAVKEARGINKTRQLLFAQDIPDPGNVLGDLLETRQRARKTTRQGMGTPASNTALTAADLDAGAVSNRTVKLHTDSTIRAMESAGYDTTRLYDVTVNKKNRTIKKLKKGDDLDAALRDLKQNPGIPTPIRPIDDVVATLRAAKGKFKGDAVSILEHAIKTDEWKGTAQAIDNLSKSGIPELADPELVRAIRNQRDNSRVIKKTKAFNDKTVAKQAERFEKAKAKAVPARFMPEVQRRTEARVKERLIDVTDPDILAETLRLADQNQWQGIPGFDEKMYRQIQREEAMGWQSWRADGFDPVFIHTVPPNKMARVLYPSDTIVPRDPSSQKKRKLDMSPGARDFSIGVNDQMMEYLARRETEVALKYVMDMKGEPQLTLRDRFYKTAESRAERAPVKDVEGHLQDLINENYRRFDPAEEGYNWGSPYLDKLKQDDMWIPHSTYSNLKSMADPRSVAGGIFDPTTKLFRIAVVGTSLRTQIYNIVGGAVSLELQSPGALFRQRRFLKEMSEGFKEMAAHKDGKLAGFREGVSTPASLDGPLKEMIGSGKQSMMQLDDIQQGKLTEGVAQYAKGKFLGKIWDSIQAKKTPGKSITGRYGDKLKGLAEASYTLNGQFDDMYRMMTYYDELERVKAAGGTTKAAQEAAIGQTRKVLQDWLGMTPMERGVMKSVIPFYSFMSHAMRFVMNYPLDHPLRAEFMTKLAMAEMEDNEGLPKRFLSALFFGDQGEGGNQSAFNLAPMNPFGDVANMMTISGMMSATNPMISTAFQMVGLDQGQQDLYPSLRYDPETGRLGAVQANPLLQLAENTVPQTSIITAMLGMNTQFNDALARDPAAANRFLISNMTVPILWRNYNVEQEQFKAEIARSDSADIVKKEALKTGDWNEAMRYPSLREYLAALDSIPDDELSPFHAGQKDAIANIQASAFKGEAPATPIPDVGTVDEKVQAILAAQPGQIAAFSSGGTMTTGGAGSPIRLPQPATSLANTTGGI